MKLYLAITVADGHVTAGVSSGIYTMLEAAMRGVRLARDEQVKSLARLRMMLLEHGHAASDVDSAFKAWAGSLVKTAG
jgi:hypothetical protein